MAEKAGVVVRDALIELTVTSDEQIVPASEINTGIRYLNRMVQGWDAKGIKLGYTLITGPNQVLTVPAGAIEGIVFNLALRLANSYDTPVNPSLAGSARRGLQTVRNIGVNPAKTAFPGNLPIGSGNEFAGGIYIDQHFFPDCCEDQNPCGLSTSDGDTNGV